MTWTTSIAGSPTYQTLSAAEAALRAHYTQDLTLRRQVVTSTGTTLVYWRGRRAPIVGEWEKYQAIAPDFGTVFASEQEVIDDAVAYYTSPCGITPSVVSNGEWTSTSTWQSSGLSNYEKRPYKITYRGGSMCTENKVLTPSTGRERTVSCPTNFSWSSAEHACIGSTTAFIYPSQRLECYSCALVGDPIDITTGDLYETESDVALGWVEFTRYYHSVTLTGQGAFGNGSWTHSHSIRLSLSSAATPVPQGVVLENGSQLSVQAVNSEYELIDGSGDRIKSDGAGGWTLQRGDRTLKFDGSGRLTAQVMDDGSALTYTYDVNNRLSKITSAVGRSLDFSYTDPYGDASVSSISSGGVVLVSYSYTAGRLTGATYPSSGTRTYEYTDSRFPNALTAIKAEDGSAYATFAYDSVGRAISSQRAGGVDGVTLTYNASGGATVTSAVTDTLSLVSTYGLTTATTGVARKVGTVDYDGHTLTRTYNSSASDFRRRLATLTDRNGVLTQYSYGESTDPITSAAVSTRTITEAASTPQQRAIVESKELSTNRLVTRVQGDRQIRVSRNARLQPQTVTVSDLAPGGASRAVGYTYCEANDVSTINSGCPVLGFLKKIDGPRPDADAIDTAAYTYYDSPSEGCTGMPNTCTYLKGDLRKITDAAGHVTEMLKYDAQGRLLSMKDANGVITDVEYNQRGWRTATKVRGTDNAVETDDLITRIDYWPTGKVKQITRPDGVYLKYDYDAAQRLTKITDPAGAFTQYTLDKAGHRWLEEIKEASTAYRTLSRGFNALGQLTAEEDRDPLDFTYDPNGNLDTVTDALNHVTDQDVDALNRVKQTRQDVGGVDAKTQYSYDALDNLTQVVDPNNLITTYTYNGFGDVTQLASPDTGTTTATFDAAGNRKTWIDARGVAATATYDALNRPASVTYGGSDPRDDTTYTYDTVQGVCASDEGFSQGRLAKVQNGPSAAPLSTLQYCYDRFGRTVRKVQTVNGKVHTLRYAYTKAGDLQSVTYPDGMVVTYGYSVGTNGTGRLNTIGVKLAGTTTTLPLIASIDNYPSGPQKKWTYGNGRVLDRGHDDNYRPVAINDTAVGGVQMGLGYDAAGHLNSLFEPANPSVEKLHYDYDGMDRLTVTKDGPTAAPLETYGYDATGNRTSFTNSGGTQTYAYVANSHRLGSVAGSLRSYDNSGNTTAMNGRVFSYTPAGRLQDVSGPAIVLPLVPMSYVYNGLGEQVRRYPTANPGAAQDYYVYDEKGHWVGSYDVNGTMKQQIVWLEDYPVGLVNLSGLKYIEPDHLGAPRAVIEVARNIAVWKWDAKSEAFGNTLPMENPDGDAFSLVFDIRFPGQRYDAASGLNYNYLRDGYDAARGRYTQPDPIGQYGGLALYAYVNGKPISLIDPFGLVTKVTIWQPVGWGESSFGHVSTDINGTTYSFGPQGMATLPTLDYLARNSFRDGVALTLNLTQKQEAELQSCLAKPQGDYLPASNNCGSPVQHCLKKVGIDIGYRALPVNLGNLLLDSGIVNGVTEYPASTPAVGSSAPWAR